MTIRALIPLSALFALLATTATAAERLPEFEDAIRHSQAGLSTETDVQRELKVTEKQTAELTKALTPIAADYASAIKKLADKKPEELPDELEKLLVQTRERAFKAVSGVLSADQLKRLNQIDLQQRAPSSYLDEVVQKSLVLTKEQLKKLGTLKVEFDVKVQKFKREAYGVITVKTIPGTELPLAGQELLTGKTYPMLKKEYALAAKNILTNDQLFKWYDLIGDTFPNPVPLKK